MDEGFAPASTLPGGRDARDQAYLGPNSVMVRESLVGPEAYTAALQQRAAAEQKGQMAGLPQSAVAGSYSPSEATRTFAEQGGPMTEYVVPGKGSATFLGERRGGGSLSVVSGRTPEEQAIIDRNVAGIDRQTAAMRDLRNAKRQAQGLPTVEQAEQAAAMQRAMPAPPNFRDLDRQAEALTQQLQSASDMRGFGTRRARADAIQAAQIGLANIAAQRNAMQQDYQTQSALAQGLFGQQQQQQSAAAKAAADQSAAQEDRRRWEATHGLNTEQARIDAMTKGENALVQRQRLALDAIKQRNPDPMKMVETVSKYMGKEGLDGRRQFDFGGFNGAIGIRPVPASAAEIKPYVPFFDEKSEEYLMYDENGQPQSLGGPIDLVRRMYQE
jgi:hypothetical protein